MNYYQQPCGFTLPAGYVGSPAFAQGPMGQPFVPQQCSRHAGFPEGVLFVEESYIENILRLNLGKVATVT